MTYDYQPYYSGIFGLSPIDDSSGPLLVDYLYQDEKIHSKLFSMILGSKDGERSLIQYGTFQKERDEKRFYDGDIN